MASNTKTLWIGDKWQIEVRYRQLNGDGTYSPFTFSADRQPAGEMYLGPVANPAFDMTIANGRCIPLNQANPATQGVVVFQLHASEIADPAILRKTNAYNRLQAMLVDLNGERATQSVTQLDIRDPQQGDIVTGVSFSTELVTVIGGNGGGGQAGGGTIIQRPVVAVGSTYIDHGFDYQPDVWAVDNFGEPVDVDYTYTTATRVSFTFGLPFTGVLYLA